MSHGLPGHAVKAARRCMKQAYMLFTGDANTCRLIERSTGNIKKITPIVHTAVKRVPFKYSVMLMALGRDEMGGEYTKAVQIDVANPCIQDQLTDQLNGLHQDLLDDFPKKHLLNIAWLASFEQTDFDEKSVFNLLKRHKAFEALADWEKDLIPS